MNDLWLILSFSFGILLGAIFYGGLWLTVQYAVTSKNTALWFFFSLLLRMAIAVSGFYFVSHRNWIYLLLCLGGFILSRILVTKLTKEFEKGGNR